MKHELQDKQKFANWTLLNTLAKLLRKSSALHGFLSGKNTTVNFTADKTASATIV